jgi:hypothetical protein
MNNRLLRPRQTTHPEAASWATRVTASGGTVSGSTLAAVSKFCRDIAAAGIRDKFYRLNLFCGGNLSSALVPLYRAESSTASVRGNSTDTNNNFVSGDFNNTGSSAGLTGNGSTKYLNTGYPANTLAAANTHLGISLLGADTSASGDRTAIGAYSTTNSSIFVVDVRGVAGRALGACGLGLYINNGAGFFGEVLNNASMSVGNILASAGTQYRNGSSVGGAPVGLTNYPSAHSLYLFANNDAIGGGAAVNFSNARLGGYSIGASMTAAQVVSFSNAMNTFNTALSRT